MNSVVTSEVWSHAIEFCKDCGDYQNNMGIRSSELNKVKIRIADTIYNNNLFLSILEQNKGMEITNELFDKIINRFEHDLENFKSLEENLDEILRLLNDDTNSAKNSTRAMIKELETYKEQGGKNE